MIARQGYQIRAEPIAPEWHLEHYFFTSQVLPIDDEEVIITPLAHTVLILGELTQLGDIFSCQDFRICCLLDIVAIGWLESTKDNSRLCAYSEIISRCSNYFAYAFFTHFIFFYFFKDELVIIF